MAETCWADYSTLSSLKVSKLFSDVAFYGPLSHFLSVYGIAVKTAYLGLIGVGQVKAGDTGVVSAAAALTGLLAGQNHGTRMVWVALDPILPKAG